MPVIERKTLDRVHSGDVLFYDAGNLLKAGQKVGENVGNLAKFNVSYITVISPTREEKAKFFDRKIDEYLKGYIEQKHRERNGELLMRLKETLMSLYVPFVETDQSFSVPGKKNFLSADDLLQRKIESLNREQVAAGSSRLLNKYKLKFAVDIMTELQGQYGALRHREPGMRDQKGVMARMHINSIRLNSWYDQSRFRTMGDSLVLQAIDRALLLLHTFTNINKKRIADERPFSEARYDVTQKKASDGIYQYKSDFILEAAVGALLSNIGLAHQSIHRIISGKPLLDIAAKGDKDSIKKIQQSINVARHLLDREDISSVSKMICTMQKEYPDGTGFPSPNENKILYEFVRLFHIISFYDQLTNPVLCRVPYSRMQVIEYMKSHSGPYHYNGESFTKQARFDSVLLDEFLTVLAPYHINEKVYLYEKGRYESPLFIGKVASYPDSHVPMISLLKDEKRDKEYRDGSMFIHLPGSCLYMKKQGKMEKKKFPWIEKLEIFDKKVDAGSIENFKDVVFGEERILHKSLR